MFINFSNDTQGLNTNYIRRWRWIKNEDDLRVLRVYNLNGFDDYLDQDAVELWEILKSLNNIPEDTQH